MLTDGIGDGILSEEPCLLYASRTNPALDNLPDRPLSKLLEKSGDMALSEMS